MKRRRFFGIAGILTCIPFIKIPLFEKYDQVQIRLRYYSRDIASGPYSNNTVQISFVDLRRSPNEPADQIEQRAWENFKRIKTEAEGPLYSLELIDSRAYLA